MMNFIDELTVLGKIYHTGFGFKCEDSTNMVMDYGYNHKGDNDDVLIPLINLTNMANKTVNYKKVILKYADNYWDEYPSKDWYNHPTKWWKDDNFKKDLLPFLSTRKYIKVINRFMEIEIDSKIKGFKITYDDILFATRGLAKDDTRTVCNYDDKYSIILNTNDILILEPHIDNYST